MFFGTTGSSRIGASASNSSCIQTRDIRSSAKMQEALFSQLLEGSRKKIARLLFCHGRLAAKSGDHNQ